MMKFGFEYSREFNLHGGIQYLFDFDNGYGASVVQHSYSCGGNQGLWELAVVVLEDGEIRGLVYDTPVTDNVEGFLDEEEVQQLLTEIKQLPNRVAA